MLYMRFTPTGSGQWTAFTNRKPVAKVTVRNGHTNRAISREELSCLSAFMQEL